MDLVECLLEDHDRLRHSMARINSFFTDNDPGHDWKTNQIEFKNALRQFIAEMTAHESVENSLLFEAMDDMGGDLLSSKREIVGDHKSIHGILGVLSSLSFLSGEVSKGAVSFAISQTWLEIEHHLAREETQIFPKLRLLPKAELEHLGHQAHEILHPSHPV